MDLRRLWYLSCLAGIVTSFSLSKGQAQPANDLFVNAWTLNGSFVSTYGHDLGATKEAGEPSHAGNDGGRSVWFRWTAPTNSQVQIDTLGSAFNTLLAVYTGNAANALSLVSSNNDATGFNGASLVEFAATGGVTYRIALDAHRPSTNTPVGGDYVLNLRTLGFAGITAPANDAVFLQGDPLEFAGAAGFSNTTPSRVDFYHGTNLAYSDTASPFTAIITNAPLGSNSVYAVAFNPGGTLAVTSATVRVIVVRAGLNIISPTDGATFLNTNAVTISALGKVPGASITNVDFLVDAASIGTVIARDNAIDHASTSATVVWNSLTPGSHRLSAIGKDDAGNVYVSEPVYVSVAQTVVPRRSAWKYLDNGSNQGTNWTLVDFNDLTWASGSAELGYGDGDEATTVSYGPNASQKYITTYFRRTFSVDQASSFSNLFINVKRDDGAVVYLNGSEAARFNMPTGTITYTNLAPLADDDGTNFFTAEVPVSKLVDGSNVLAVEVHQNAPNSPDLSFDMDLLAVPKIVRNDAPTVSLTSPANGAGLIGPTTITLEALASGSVGISKVEFFADGVKVGEDTVAPYSVEWSSPGVGRHLLYAAATDDQLAVAFSSSIVINVFNLAGDPFGEIATPANGAVFAGPTNVAITAYAGSPAGITNVQFLANGTIIGSDPASPFTALWNASFGSNGLVAVAFDSNGRMATSAIVSAFITVPPTNVVAPAVATQNPLAGSTVSNLTTISVTFTEPVSGVSPADLLVNGVPAVQVSGEGSNYIFSVIQPNEGPVGVTWATGHGIADFGWPSTLGFDENAPGASWTYNFVDRTAPVIVGRNPLAGATVTNLTRITVVFSEPVTGVDASDMRINGIAASGLEGAGSTYTFTFAQPALGNVVVLWNAAHGITDLASSPNAFNSTTLSVRWNYLLDEQIPPTVASVNPLPGSHVTNLTQVTVTFSEAVTNVNASDLLVNGIAAASVSGSGATYTFSVAPRNTSVLNFTWAVGHGIQDRAPSANPFDATALGATWSYTTVDNTAPSGSIYPPPSTTIRRLTQVRVTFDEPVTGVDPGDLTVNGVPAQTVNGVGAGPYTFSVSAPSTGTVQVAFATGHGIMDLASPPNTFTGGVWTYVIDPTIPTEIAITRVVQISLDGLGAKYLEPYVRTAPSQFPTFVRLMAESAYTFNARCDFDISETVPNHVSMFTGRPVFQPLGLPDTTQHGYNNNFPTATETIHNAGNSNVAYKASMFDVAHDYGRSTAFYTGKTRLSICERSYDATNGAPDVIGIDNGRDKIDFASVADVSGVSITNEVNAIVSDLSSASPRQYNFIHIAEPDLTGHASNWGSTNWSNIVRTVDAQLGRIIDAIDSNPVMAGQTALIVTADHGGGGVMPNGHTESYHITNYTVPFFLRAPGIPPGADLYALFANRQDPGTNRTDYTTQPQPIRNGDGSNLGLMLIGLPPIPGSFMTPVFVSSTVSLTIARFEDRIGVFWSDPSNDYVLEASDTLLPVTGWQAVTEGITVSDTTKIYSVTNATGGPRFFRLRR